MTAQGAQALLIPEAVLDVLQVLSPEQRQEVFDFAEFLAQKQGYSVVRASKPVEKPKRIRDLDGGQLFGSVMTLMLRCQMNFGLEKMIHCS